MHFVCIGIFSVNTYIHTMFVTFLSLLNLSKQIVHSMSNLANQLILTSSPLCRVYSLNSLKIIWLWPLLDNVILHCWLFSDICMPNIGQPQSMTMSNVSRTASNATSVRPAAVAMEYSSTTVQDEALQPSTHLTDVSDPTALPSTSLTSSNEISWWVDHMCMTKYNYTVVANGYDHSQTCSDILNFMGYWYLMSWMLSSSGTKVVICQNPF